MPDAWKATTEFLERELIGVSLLQWVLFLIFILVFYAVIRFVVSAVRMRFQSFAESTEIAWDDYVVKILENTRGYGVLGLAVFLALHFVALDKAGVEGSLRALSLVLMFVQIGVWGNAFIDVLLHKGFQVAGVNEATAQTSSGIVRWFAMVLLWVCIGLLILTAFNVEVTPLIAGLGVGGIAIGMALQHILQDIFCSVAIVLDRPFEVGDFIILGDYMGAVERIGIKTTRLRSLGGEQIIMSNSDLLGSRVRNYKRMQERRITFGFGLTYATPADKLKQIPDIVAEIIKAEDKARFDRCHFKAFGDSALNFETVYYVLTPDFNQYMDIQQRINLELMSRLEKMEVEMAFPSRSIYLDPAAMDVFKQLKG